MMPARSGLCDLVAWTEFKIIVRPVHAKLVALPSAAQMQHQALQHRGVLVYGGGPGAEMTIDAGDAGPEDGHERVQRALQNSWAVVFAHAREDQLPSAKEHAEPQHNAGGSSVRSMFIWTTPPPPPPPPPPSHVSLLSLAIVSGSQHVTHARRRIHAPPLLSLLQAFGQSL